MKKLFVVVLAIALIAATIIPFGTASACPQQPGIFRPIHVSGTLEFVSWPIEEMIYTLDEATGDYVMSNNIITWNMHGDLEGTLVENVTQRGNINDPYHYTRTADHTFEGTLMGQPVSFQAKLFGTGTFTVPPPEGFEGSESWFTWIVRGPQSNVRGTIFYGGTFTHESQDLTYCGTLFWQRGMHW